MLLKQADQLVREGRYEDALRVISRVRAADPGNIYALAYEERVLSLLNGHRQRILNRGVLSPGEQHDLPPVDEQMANLATPRGKSGCADQVTEHMRARVALMLSRAHELRNRGEFDSALDEVSRAFLIDSSSPELIRLERQLWKERTISLMRVRAKQGGSHPTSAPPESMIRERGESRPDVDEHISHSRSEHTEAQEIEFQQGETPTDDQASRVEEFNRAIQEESIHTRAAADVPNILAAANRLRSLHRYEEALREIERVSFLEPRNPSIEKCVGEIRQQMIDQDSWSVAELLAEAEAFRQCRDYARALNALAGAYTIAPESKEVRKLEMAIRREELLQHESG